MTNEQERDELALELFIADNRKQPREVSIADWWCCQGFEAWHYKDMATGAIAAGWRKR